MYEKQQKIMKKDIDLQTRRDFFKIAVKGVLPILGTLALINTPIVKVIAGNMPQGCQFECMGSCYGGCFNTCYSECVGSCSGSCHMSCRTECYMGCKNGCSGSCRAQCHYTCRNTCYHGPR